MTPLKSTLTLLGLAAAMGLCHGARAAEIIVKPGQKILDAVNAAKPGDVIVVEPGEYHESISVDKPFITLRGVVNGDKRPILMGDEKLSDGVIASGDFFRITGFRVTGYKGNGVTVQGAKNIYIGDLDVDKSGIYGIYPVNCDGVTVEHTRTRRIADAGVYVGQSRNIIVRWNVVTESVAGIEIENSENALVEYNMTYNNTGGILAFTLPGLKEKTGNTTRILNNFIVDNNHPNFADPKGIVARVPVGTGILLVAQDSSVVAGNYIAGNQSFGVAVVGLDLVDDIKKDPLIDPNSDNNRIEENYYLNNGTQTHGMLKAMSPKGADVAVVGAGKGNCINPVPGMTRMLGAKSLPPCQGDRDTFVKQSLEAAFQGYAERTAQRLSMNAHGAAPTGLGFDPAHPPAGTHVVVIENMTYKPMQLKVKKGERVVWINKDGAAHTVTSSKGGTDLDPTGPLQSPMMDKGMTFEYTFKNPGKFIYLCLPHIAQAPMRDATVTVE